MEEARSTSFAMHGARDAIAAGLKHIERHVISIEQAVVENPSLAFDLAKTLIESVCRSVLDERAIAFKEDDDLPKLFKTATHHLPFLPPTASGAAKNRESLKRTLTGLSTAILGICELRNQCGFASHGSGTPRPPMEPPQALLAAEAADAIVGFIHRVHRMDRTLPTPTQASYDSYPDFNDHLDEIHNMIRIFEVEFRPSEVLFQMEPESYRVYLAEFSAGADGTDDSALQEPKVEMP